MRSNGHDSKRRGGNNAGGRTSTKTISDRHGANGTGRTGDGKVQSTSIEDGSQSLKILFDPIDDECPGGVCPVPWAADTSGDSLDVVNHPAHYTDGGIECIEAIEAQLTPEEYRGYLKGNVAKYVWREKHKGGIQSLEKAQWYLSRLIEGK